MTKRKPSIYDPSCLIDAIRKWPNPMYDKKHGYYIYLEGKAISNQTREEHIVKYNHALKVRDLESVPQGIIKYFDYKKDPVYKDTFNYYIKRKGRDKGYIKVSIQLDGKDSKHAWIKTIYITYNMK